MGVIAEERHLKVIHSLSTKPLIYFSGFFCCVFAQCLQGIDKPCNKVYYKVITVKNIYLLTTSL